MDNYNNYETPIKSDEDKNPKNNTLVQGIKIALILIALFALGNLIGSLTNIQRIENFETVTDQNLTTIQTTLPSTTILPTEEITTEITTTETTTVPTTQVTTTAVTTTEDAAADSKEEIVSLFNESANKVKKNAKKVIRNYENLSHDERNSDYPVALKLAYNSLINSWIVNHDTPIEYAKAQGGESDLIKANFPVKGKDWTSKLTADYVDSATLTEKDGRYHIVISLSDCVNPAENEGVCSVMEEVNLAKVQELVPVVKACDTRYYDCKIECIIEKDTGNMVYAKYTQPMILSLVAGRVTDMDATFAMAIESEFEIEY